MYEAAFGLSGNPFMTTPDTRFLYLGPAHREALAGMIYSIRQGRGFMLLTGEAGTGKTTLLRMILDSVQPAAVNFSFVFTPTVAASEFLELAMADFGISAVPASKAARILKLQEFLLATYEARKVAVLVIDEAHKLSLDVLEELRLLTNFETADRKLLQIILAGQSELDAFLDRDDMRQLKQRIAYRVALKPLANSEVGRYIAHRWKRAGGGDSPPFRAEAVERIAAYSRGIPRSVNVICDNALLVTFAAGAASVPPEVITEVARDLRMQEPTAASAPGQAPAPVADTTLRIEVPPPVALDATPLATLNEYLPRRRGGFSAWLFGNNGKEKLRQIAATEAKI